MRDATSIVCHFSTGNEVELVLHPITCLPAAWACIAQHPSLILQTVLSSKWRSYGPLAGYDEPAVAAYKEKPRPPFLQTSQMPNQFLKNKAQNIF
jgi:hypothetical protein